jgi:Ca2+-binding EF-hand superfamily protein
MTEMVGRRLGESEGVFGMAADINSRAASSVFIGLTLLLVLLEVGFDKLEHWADHHQSKELFEKLKKELTMMGILSFTVFVYQTAYAEATESAYYEAFEMSHIIILFIAISFIIQASFLLNFAIQEGQFYLKTSRTTASDLLASYNNMKQNSKWQSWFFEHAPYWIPTIPSFRNDIRNKMMEALFISQHKLPHDFRFAQYMSKLFQKYISELGEVSPINWAILGGLVALNFAKISTIDQYEVNEICGHPVASPEGDPEDRRFLRGISMSSMGGMGGMSMNEHSLRGLEEESSGEEEVDICFLYIFRYGIVVLSMLFCFIFTMYVVSSYYFEELLKIACKRQNVNMTKELGRGAYITILEKIAANNDSNIIGSNNIRTKSRTMSSENEKDTKVKVFHSNSKKSSTEQPLLDNQTISPLNKNINTEDAEMEALMEDQLEEIRELVEERNEKKRKSYSWWWYLLEYCGISSISNTNTNTIKSDKAELRNIFFWGSTKLYFILVELTLLLQCFYIAMWATQIIPMVVAADQDSFGWGIAFTLPCFLNFGIIRMILKRAVMLQAICEVHSEVLGEVKEEAIEEEHCLEKLRKAVRDTVKLPPKLEDSNKNITENALSEDFLTALKVNMKALFSKYDDDNSGEIGKDEFLMMLTDLKVYISKRALKILWQAIDYDLSNALSWDEMFVILFPELKSVMKEELAIVRLLRTAISDRLLAQNIRTKEKMTDYMRIEFDRFDEDKSGFIDENEMMELVKEYIPAMDNKEAKRLFAAIDIDGEGGIEWEEFRELVFGIEQIQDQRSTNWI